jgi:hypothetical protein
MRAPDKEMAVTLPYTSFREEITWISCLVLRVHKAALLPLSFAWHVKTSSLLRNSERETNSVFYCPFSQLSLRRPHLAQAAGDWGTL